jgi:deoxyribodipyrimidine photo-lyase
MGTLLKSSGDPYTVFTPFLNNATKTTRPDKPATRISGTFGSSSELRTLEGTYPIQHEQSEHVTNIQPGGRRAALQQLTKAVRAQKNYAKNHNKLTIQTSRLSAYIKFGCVSIREVYWKIRPIRSQLYWREFYYYIVKYFPRVLSGSANFNTRIKPIAWNTSASDFKAWCSGTTGYPIVDAGMRQLNTTGYMHNRARLITANFLNRILNIDWRKGEHYYAQQLTDYDPAINNGNWQWIASTGVDPKPYNQRLFNPWLQSQKFDPQAEYIKKWVPELRDVPATHIHHWSEYAHLHSHATKYPQPIVDYEFARKRSLSVYKKSFT